jgi:alpha-glucosidase
MMYFSIPQALSMSLFGIPFFGPDTCGFQGNTDMELCSRWMQLSAFFPFYRNHNQLAAISQEPYVWESVADATRKAINIRYSILPYIYTLHHRASTTGSTVMRALSWEFPADGPALADADRQFLLGPSLLVTPVLTPLAENVSGVFPGWSNNIRWYDWYTLSLANNIGSPDNVTMYSPLGDIRLFVRGGSVLPMQTPGYTTAESRKGEWSLLIALDSGGSAEGQLYLDDGESLVVDGSRDVTFTVSMLSDITSLVVSTNGTYVDENALANVTVAGVREEPCQVSWNGVALGEEATLSWNETSGVWRIGELQNLTTGGAWMEGRTLSWKSKGC